MMSINFSDIAILNIKGSDYHCIISSIRKNEAIKLMQSAALPEKKWNIIKIGKEILTFGNIKIELKNYRQKTSVFERCRYLKIISI